jgi:hypothetical protein
MATNVKEYKKRFLNMKTEILQRLLRRAKGSTHPADTARSELLKERVSRTNRMNRDSEGKTS